MRKEESHFYLVDLQILPEAIKKAIKVKEMLKDGTCGNINEAVQKVKMSRSGRQRVMPGQWQSISRLSMIRQGWAGLSR